MYNVHNTQLSVIDSIGQVGTYRLQTYPCAEMARLFVTTQTPRHEGVSRN